MSCSKIDIGERIAALRNSRKLSQQELSVDLNVSREVVAKWEIGTRDLKTEHTTALADYFGVTCDEILRGVKSENVDIHAKTGLSDEAITVLRELSGNNILNWRMLILNNLITNSKIELLADAIINYSTEDDGKILKGEGLRASNDSFMPEGDGVDAKVLRAFVVQNIMQGILNEISTTVFTEKIKEKWQYVDKYYRWLGALYRGKDIDNQLYARWVSLIDNEDYETFKNEFYNHEPIEKMFVGKHIEIAKRYKKDR